MESSVSNKPVKDVPHGKAKIDHPGMMGDGTEEQNLNEPGDPSKKINADEVKAAFDTKASKKS
jgi:hypothetical protein